MKIMITDGGVHPADKWAEVTTDAILDLIQIREDSQSRQAGIARRDKIALKPLLFDVLNDQHDRVQKHERGVCGKHAKLADAHKHAESQIDPLPHVPTALEAVNAVLSKSVFANHFAKPDTQATVQNIIGQHFADSMNIERRTHKDRLAAKGA